jgi:hypothetical protein
VSGNNTTYIHPSLPAPPTGKPGLAALSRKKQIWHLLQSKWRRT